MTDTPSVEIQEFALWEKMQAKHAIFSFELELTARCNLACRHCYINLPAGDREAQSRELTAGEIDGIADQAVELGAVWVLLTGGEPLLREDFTEIYMNLKRKGLLVSVFTNATLLGDEHVTLFRKYPPRDIEITIYGATAETYERVTRRPGSFDDFMKGLNRLLGSGIRVRLKAMAMRSNYAEMSAVAAFCRTHTKDYFRFDPQLHLRFDGNARRNKEIIKERLTPDEIVALENADKERFNTQQKDFHRRLNGGGPLFDCNHLFHCFTGIGSFTIGFDGIFRLCQSLWAPETLYDLRKGTLRDACGKHVPKVREMHSNRREFLETCHGCELIDICLWCPAHAYLETSELDGSVPYFCEVAHARVKTTHAKQ